MPLIGYILNVISSHFSNVIQIPVPYVAVIQIGTDGIWTTAAQKIESSLVPVGSYEHIFIEA